MAAFLSKLKAIWVSLWSHPWFSTPAMAAVGVLGGWLYSEATTGTFVWNAATVQKELSLAFAAAVISLHQLYMPSPKAKP
jgi:hypothetical protein